ncbi:MAG: hypothetical protein JOY69_09975 [Candidatus Eremiobacteraeota bacterium]|nr:hypothetical protein [Candidatus Eremiobacteraeota bacterium]
MKTSVVRSSLLALLMTGSAFAVALASTVTLQPSTLSFKQALSACAGSLGSVTFTLGHARTASLPGVTEQVDTSSAGIDSITFTDSGGKSATATANGHTHAVSAKNLQVKWKNQLACINPD